MTLTITLRPDFEEQLCADAASAGLPPEELAARRIEEAPLLERVTNWIDPEVWRRYRELAARQQEEAFGETERQELLRLNHLVEGKHAERLERIARLARLRGVSLDEALRQLGIQFPLPA